MEHNLSQLFESLRNPSNWADFLSAAKGSDFENIVKLYLRSDLGFVMLDKKKLKEKLGDDAFSDLKAKILSHTRVQPIYNPAPELKHHICPEPYGSQEYPDILVFSGNKVHCIELKFSKGRQGRPKWNGGGPRQRGIYIFGSRKRGESGEITFFLGRDVLPLQQAKAMNQFFNEMAGRQKCFNKTQLNSQRYGFAVYVRRDFDQSKTFNSQATMDFFKNTKRAKLEQNVIDAVS